MTIGDQPTFPKDGSPYGYQGMTYRMWLVGQIAAGVIQEQWNEAYEITAQTIINRADAIIKRMEGEGK